MRQDEESEFREGIVVDRPTRPGHGSFVNCGMKKVGIGRVGWDIRSRRTQATEGRQGPVSGEPWPQASVPTVTPLMQIWAREVPPNRAQ